ncbi:MAG: amidohydrolase [Clostridia bacterium]|nr:amidohydrolase [Clostridia bacterium]
MNRSILFKNARLAENAGFADNKVFISVINGVIDSISTNAPEDTSVYERIVDCRSNLVLPAFYNTHTHIAMSALRGYGENLPLHRWLNERIFPAEDRLTSEIVYAASMLSIAEMIKNGIVSFSDMYMFSADTARAAIECDVKANISRAVVAFDPTEDPRTSTRVQEAIALYRDYNGAQDGRIKIDLSVHAEYTVTEPMCRYVASLAKEYGTGIHVHLSETESEHMEGIGRRGKTPTAFFADCGLFDTRAYAAHCVYVTEEDMDILKAKNVSVIHNPVSNLKLGSGVMPLDAMLEKGINVALGTDGASSNNSQSILKELQLAAILHKGIQRRAEILHSDKLLSLTSLSGALSQGREDCGKIAPGYKADLILLNLNTPHNIPCYTPSAIVCYSAENSDVLMTVCDGRILYENGEFTTIDIERVMYDAQKAFAIYS